MLCVTHEMGFARQVADRVIFMDAGQIVEMNDAGRVLRQPAARAHQAVPEPDPALEGPRACAGATRRGRPGVDPGRAERIDHAHGRTRRPESECAARCLDPFRLPDPALCRASQPHAGPGAGRSSTAGTASPSWPRPTSARRSAARDRLRARRRRSHPPGRLARMTARLGGTTGLFGIGGVIRDMADTTDMLCHEVPGVLRADPRRRGHRRPDGAGRRARGAPRRPAARLGGQCAADRPRARASRRPSWGGATTRRAGASSATSAGYRVADWMMRPLLET